MINTWFTSDTHFSHKNILKYEKEARPFENVYVMNEALIDRWNSVVKARDVVYHLGDISLDKRSLSLIGKLNGHKRLVMGNHDIHPMAELCNYFEKIYGAFEYKGCILTHIPIHPACMGRYKLNVHGHLHSKNIYKVMDTDGDCFEEILTSCNDEDSCGDEYVLANEQKNYFNVSVEQNNLTPINFDVIKERIRLLGGNDE